MIKTAYASPEEITVDRREVYRYMGCGKSNADERVAALAESVIGEMLPRLQCKACYDRFPVIINNDTADLGFTVTRSKNLIKNLDGCDEIILFTATAGIDADRIIQKSSMLSPLRAVAAQAVGAAAIESWCDILCERFKVQEERHGNYLRPRFSPGYGDLPLEMQKKIFAVLDCGRKIGVTLNESLLMSPSKSVSAIIGIGKNRLDCSHGGCASCTKTDCEFRLD